jgi:choline dehydrogenase-like flavoprotein
MMRSYNFFEMPGGFKIGHPGDDIHYAGTLPMKKNPRKYETTLEGEVAGLPGIFVVDGSVLNSLPLKSHTYTIMANANRIGSICAKFF